MMILYPFPEPLPLQKARAVQVVKTVASLAARGVEVHLAYVPVAGHPDPFQAYGMTCPAGVTLVPLSRSLPFPLHRLRVHSNAFFFRRLCRVIRRQAESQSPYDAVFVRHLKLAHALLGLEQRPPLVFEAHEIFAAAAPPSKQKKVASLEEAVLRGAEVILAISQGLAGLVRERYRLNRSIPVVPSATDWPESLPEKSWPDAGQRIVYAGNLYGWKGVQDLVDAAASLPGYRIEIIGGETRQIEELRQQASASGAQLVFRGHLAHQQVARALADACIAVLPNRAGSVSAYTSPLKLFEYMAAGCAIVASDLPVFREVLDTEDAAWFEPGNPDALAAAIRSLGADPGLARSMGERLRTKAATFTWYARAGRLMALIEEARRAEGHPA